MDTSLKLSIIVPVYNSLPFLSKNLERLHSINSELIEFVLVNDGSTDNSLILCQKYALLDNRFKVLSKGNGGVSSARNYGIIHARGEYIFFLDADDYVSDRFLDIVLPIIRLNLNFVIFRRYYVVRDCIEYNYRFISKYFKEEQTNLFKVIDIESLFCKKCGCSGSGEILFKKSLIQQERFNPDMNLLEDYDFFFRIIYKNDLQIYVYNGITTYINDEVPNSLTRKRISYKQVRPGSLLANPMLLKYKKLSKQMFWIESYFHVKKMNFYNRLLYIINNAKLLLQQSNINKYFLGFILFLFGIDINRIKNSLKKKPIFR